MLTCSPQVSGSLELAWELLRSSRYSRKLPIHASACGSEAGSSQKIAPSCCKAHHCHLPATASLFHSPNPLYWQALIWNYTGDGILENPSDFSRMQGDHGRGWCNAKLATENTEPHTSVPLPSPSALTPACPPLCPSHPSAPPSTIASSTTTLTTISINSTIPASYPITTTGVPGTSSTNTAPSRAIVTTPAVSPIVSIWHMLENCSLPLPHGNLRPLFLLP